MPWGRLASRSEAQPEETAEGLRRFVSRSDHWVVSLRRGRAAWNPLPR